MRFSLLGPLRVECDEHVRTPTALRPRRVLAMLLVHANQAVPVASLVDELWDGDQVPRLARKTVQTYIYQLRKALSRADGSSPIVSQPQSYLCRLTPGELDLWEFERCTDRGRDALVGGDPRTAADLLHQAMALWRGHALVDVDPGPLLAIEIRHLEDKFVKGVELRVDADMRLGRHWELLGELEALTERYPLHECFYAHLIVAAYRSGFRQDALRAYGRLRHRLVEDLGLEPSKRLQQLHRDVLADNLAPAPAAEARPQRVATDRPEAAPAQLPPDTPDFVGREPELRLVESFCSAPPEDPDQSTRRVMAVIGPPGVGKTSFAVRVAHRLRRRFPGGQLYACLHDDQDQPVPPETALAGFLCAAGFGTGAIPATTIQRRDLFRTWAADRELLVLLDDAASYDQVRPLLPAGGGCRVLITARNRLPGLPGVDTVQLGPIETDEGVALLSGVAGAARIVAEMTAARGAVLACEGLPLAIRAAGERLAARPLWSVAELSDRLADPSRRLDELTTGDFGVRQHMLRAWRRLGTAERTAMLRLCPFEGTFTLDMAAVALELDPLAAEVRVGSLVESNLLGVVAGGRGGRPCFRFPELLRLAVLQHADLGR
ncbi:MAG: winged helix-turn-helix domain-containing protein [Micromonosporaceae bacterium]|nr:winged helix-turn-helix domain-containing protein [Micromonosporaceae bacterium]